MSAITGEDIGAALGELSRLVGEARAVEGPKPPDEINDVFDRLGFERDAIWAAAAPLAARVGAEPDVASPKSYMAGFMFGVQLGVLTQRTADG